MNTRDNTQQLPAMPDLIYPQLEWHEADYARLAARLDLFSDFIVLSKFQQGQMTEQYLVDPLDVATALAGLNVNSGLLPDNCLFWSKKDGYDGLGVYVPPRVWPVTVRPEPRAWRVPLPGLVFTGRGYDYSVWAVLDRPASVETQLYMAPCPNVSLDGVCRGNAPFPRATPATLWQAVDVFFASRFNRDLSNQKSRAYPDSILDQWRALHQAAADSYPLDDLVGTNLTLGRLIDA
jgi:hypothetical protein